ncbi:Glucooligosaccharide oxidase [Mycena sanguinolenta]|uniref:Glucooligosaccharide oxidase n=1 Tax=Mycena sanguinolenta TaxID=230812 RepID=A0A8H6XSX6_9AGAR|nr:Glucooligosaccharide oxidase [Mycena sanguinolenta]
MGRVGKRALLITSCFPVPRPRCSAGPRQPVGFHQRHLRSGVLVHSCAEPLSATPLRIGVNKLSSQVSSVSTNIVLTVRKAISLCFSVWWFGNPWNAGLGIGASMVFCGSLLFTVSGPKKIDTQKKKE